MEKVKISKDFFCGFSPILGKGSESLILYKDDVVAKLVDKDLLHDDRENITERLETLDHEGLVKPQSLLYERKKYRGYMMKLLKDSKSLIYFINNEFDDEIIPFSERKRLMIDLCRIFDYFYKNQYAYYDIHGDNFLVSNGQINIIDLDGGVFKGYTNNDVDYDLGVRIQTKYLSKYALAFLYNMSKQAFQRLAKDTPSIFRSIPKNLRRFYAYALDEDYSVYEGITESIDSIDENVYSKTRELMKKKAYK